jgi:predicted O-linked N-acetylglucosamine transferase (SPINDLY family)
MLTYLLRRFFAERKSARLLAKAQRLHRQGAFAEAEQACLGCAAAFSGIADVHHLRGLIATKQERYEDAVGHLEAAIAERDSDASFHSTLAEAFEKLGRHERAASQFARALERLAPADPARPRAMLRLAAALQDSDNQQEAEQWYRRILDVDPGNREALLCLAVAREDSDIEEARSIMARYVTLQGGGAPRLRRALMLPAILESSAQIDEVRQRLDRDLDELLEDHEAPKTRNPEFEIGTTPFYLAYHGRNNTDLMRNIARACRSVYPTQTECPRRSSFPGSKIRIGFVSTHFHTHSVGRVTFGLIRDLPRDRFDVHVFAIAPRADDWAETIRRSADHYASLPLDLDRVRGTIEAAALDILFFADIGMDPLTYFLAFWRLAPIQMVTWGHSVTSGIDTIDYYVSADAVEAAGSEQYYSEKLVRLPGYFMPRYRRPTLAARPAGPQTPLLLPPESVQAPSRLRRRDPGHSGARSRRRSPAARVAQKLGGARSPTIRPHARPRSSESPLPAAYGLPGLSRLSHRRRRHPRPVSLRGMQLEL